MGNSGKGCEGRLVGSSSSVSKQTCLESYCLVLTRHSEVFFHYLASNPESDFPPVPGFTSGDAFGLVFFVGNSTKLEITSFLFVHIHTRSG